MLIILLDTLKLTQTLCLKDDNMKTPSLYLKSATIAFMVTALNTSVLAQNVSENTSAIETNHAAQLENLIDQYWQYSLEQSPTFASSLGIKEADGKLADVTLESQNEAVKKAQSFLEKLLTISADGLTSSQKADYGILKRTLDETIESQQYPQRAANFTNRSGWHQRFAGMAGNLPFRTASDYQSYNDRLRQYDRINKQSIDVANVAIASKVTLPCDAIVGYEKSISGLLADDPRSTRFYSPYAKAKPNNIDEEKWQSLSNDAQKIIDEIIFPAIKIHEQWYLNDYKPACSVAPGVSQQPSGADYYDFRIRQMTTTTMGADEIHNLGLSEVARIRAEMVEVSKLAGYETREAFIEHLRTDPQYYAKTPEELMRYVARVTKDIDGKMPSLFGRLAVLPYGIKEIPAEIAEGTTTAYYNPGSPEIGLAGFYFVNTSKLDQRPLWEVPALSVHEAVPGHHHQIALQQELPLSDFRKNGAFFTAFVEGWGLYSERLGIEMGLYDTPAKNMGRLSYEMWRACRLVVDTGIHSKGWSKQKAIDYMLDNTALTQANIEAEVNRYISWPGQALAYKIGELKIRELRTLAEENLGDKFDIREFHDIVLGQGAVPLEVLENQVKDWLKSELAK